MTKPAHILIVDDEPDIRTVIRIPLQARSYKVSEAENGTAAVEFIRKNPNVDLILMDIMMPGMSGVETCRAIREISKSPILFLTAKTREEDMMQAYSSGGDDFLGKPFSQAELLMKTESLIRRYRVYQGKTQEDAGLICGSVLLDQEQRRVYKNGEPVELTDTEYQIFQYLMQRRGKTVTACELYEGVWHEKYFSTSGNTIMVHILNLRKKLENDAKNPELIRTVWGKGYQID